MNVKKSENLARWLISLLAFVSVCLFTMAVHAKSTKNEREISALGIENSEEDRVTIQGVVIDAQEGTPMIGVSVIEKGTNNGTMTDLDGKYLLRISPNKTVVFSFLGFTTQEMKVGKEGAFNISLKEDVHMLGEVIAIGYGSARKEDLSMAISTIKIDQTMKSQTSNFGTMLQGRLPGVTIQSRGGDPFSDAFIAIRGRGSRGDDDDMTTHDSPLFVVDGVMNAPFNVEDIETVTVLKDAASAAIYGASVGSGGVILITTKQAEVGKIRISVSASNGIKKTVNLPKSLTAEEYNMVSAKAAEIEGTSLPIINDPEKFPWGNITRTDWMDEIFRTAYVQHYAVSVSGGDKNAKVAGSVSYDKQEGTLLNTWTQKIGARLNVDLALTNWLRLKENVTFQYGTGQGEINTSHEGPFIEAVRYPRSATIYEYDEEGNMVLDDNDNPLFGGTTPLWSNSAYGNLRNPVAELKRLNQHRPDSKIFSTTTLEARPISRLTIKSDFTAGFRTARIRKFFPRVPEKGRPDGINTLEIDNKWDTNWLWENTANYVENFADKHDLSLMAGYTMSLEKTRNHLVSASNFAKEADINTMLGLAGRYDLVPPTETHLSEAMISGLIRGAYSFDDRYFVTASARKDATSRLPRHNRAEVFYAVSGQWKVSSEPLVKSLDLSFLSLFKLRGGWGQIGNVKSALKQGDTTPIGTTEDYINMGHNNVRGMYTKGIVNKNLTWETSEQTGVGFDLAILNNSLELSVDYFDKKTKNLIDLLPVPDYLGIDPPMANIGQTTNKGWEFSASYTKKIGEVTVNVYGNLATLKTSVDVLGFDPYTHDLVVDGLTPLASTIGRPWRSFYLYEALGVFKNQDQINTYMHKDPITGEASMIQPDAKPGDIIYRDINGDGVIDGNDMDFQGSYQPKITYGFGTQLSYKGFDFNMFFQGVGGNKIYNGFKQMGIAKGGQGFNMLRDVLDSWTFNPESNFPRLPMLSGSGINYTRPSSFFLESGSYLRLKNITVGYTLPRHVLGNIGLHSNSLRFYATAENLATITPYSGVDPEVGDYGVDRSTYPLARTFTFGFNFNF